MDTAYVTFIQANDIIRRDSENLTNIIADKAKEQQVHHHDGAWLHGVHAEPTTFGLKLATWYSEMKRNIERFDMRLLVLYYKISGAVGNCQHPTIRRATRSRQAWYPCSRNSTQVLPRPSRWVLCGSCQHRDFIERMATEIRGLQKWEQREVEEFFAKGQRFICNFTNATLSVLRTWQVTVVTWWQSWERGSLARTWHLSLISRAHHHTRYDHLDWLHAQPFWKYHYDLTVFLKNMIRNMNSTGLIFSQRAVDLDWERDDPNE